MIGKSLTNVQLPRSVQQMARAATRQDTNGALLLELGSIRRQIAALYAVLASQQENQIGTDSQDNYFSTINNTAFQLQNKSGVAASKGMVAVSNLATNGAFSLSTAAGQTNVIGVVYQDSPDGAAAAIADDAYGLICSHGYCTVYANAATPIARGDFIKASATQGVAMRAESDYDLGAFGIALEGLNSGTGLIQAIVWPTVSEEWFEVEYATASDASTVDSTRAIATEDDGTELLFVLDSVAGTIRFGSGFSAAFANHTKCNLTVAVDGKTITNDGADWDTGVGSLLLFYLPTSAASTSRRVAFLTLISEYIQLMTFSTDAGYTFNAVEYTLQAAIESALADTAWLAGRSGGQTLTGSTLTGEDLTLKDNAVDANTATLTQIRAAITASHAAVTVTDTDTIDLTLATQALSADVKKQMSIDSDASGIKLSGDAASPGNLNYYGTNAAGTKGFYLLNQNYPDGTVVNGKIVPSVASNNLTVALKTHAGTDPSATDPVHVWIGGTKRTITAALSVTRNAGTDWFGAGTSLMATQEIDYFAYIGYNATDGVTIGFARIPRGINYGSFSTTSTSNLYCAISTITNAVAADNYVLIGRFNAILSAGAGYTWSLPATQIIINRPIFETRWLSWAPTLASTATISGYTRATYIIRGASCKVHFYTGQMNVTGAGAYYRLLFPIIGVPTICSASQMFYNGAAWQVTQIIVAPASQRADIYKGVGLTAWAGTEANAQIALDTEYEI